MTKIKYSSFTGLLFVSLLPQFILSYFVSFAPSRLKWSPVQRVGLDEGGGKWHSKYDNNVCHPFRWQIKETVDDGQWGQQTVISYYDFNLNVPQEEHVKIERFTVRRNEEEYMGRELPLVGFLLYPETSVECSGLPSLYLSMGLDFVYDSEINQNRWHAAHIWRDDIVGYATYFQPVYRSLTYDENFKKIRLLTLEEQKARWEVGDFENYIYWRLEQGETLIPMVHLLTIDQPPWAILTEEPNVINMLNMQEAEWLSAFQKNMNSHNGGVRINPPETNQQHSETKEQNAQNGGNSYLFGHGGTGFKNGPELMVEEQSLENEYNVLPVVKATFTNSGLSLPVNNAANNQQGHNTGGGGGDMKRIWEEGVDGNQKR